MTTTTYCGTCGAESASCRCGRASWCPDCGDRVVDCRHQVPVYTGGDIPSWCDRCDAIVADCPHLGGEIPTVGELDSHDLAGALDMATPSAIAEVPGGRIAPTAPGMVIEDVLDLPDDPEMAVGGAEIDSPGRTISEQLESQGWKH